jgi:hypothetical protein
MATQITLNSTTGTLPLDIWICDSCDETSTCIYVGTATSLPYLFLLPTIYETFPTYSVKFIDSNNCEYCNDYSEFKNFMDNEIFEFMDDTPYEFQ